MTESQDEKNPPKTKVVGRKTILENRVEVRKHWANIKEILLNSNATPIRGHTDKGYSCCFCPNEYINPADLKKHGLDHTVTLDAQNLVKLVPSDIKQICIKLDITALTCKICENSTDTVEELLNHLKQTHNKQVFTDVTHQILPFKFDSENLQCYICKKVFNKFKKLMEHTNVHYKNFKCDICDAGFVNRRKLYYHKNAHSTGKYSCDKCQKVFSTYNKKQSHERQYHKKATVYKCRLCSAVFNNNRQKDKHLITDHGAKSIARKCQACDKTFVHHHSLMIHMKRHHMVERSQKCEVCGKGFFSPSEVKMHMLTHTGQKEYKCDLCFKSYARKWTLREHMRIHTDDRRFKCEHCGDAFLQKCTWRGHMRMRHGEEV